MIAIRRFNKIIYQSSFINYKMDSIKVFAPATVANVVCGYDVLGFAIQEPGDEIILKKNDSNQIVITKIEGDNGKLPKDSNKNVVSHVIRLFLEKINLHY